MIFRRKKTLPPQPLVPHPAAALPVLSAHAELQQDEADISLNTVSPPTISLPNESLTSDTATSIETDKNTNQGLTETPRNINAAPRVATEYQTKSSADLSIKISAEPSKQPEQKMGWLQKLRHGLSRSSTKLGEGLSAVFAKRKLDQEALDELEDLLISADLGPGVASKLVSNFSKNRFGKDITDREVKEALAADIAQILKPFAQPLVLGTHSKPFVILVSGVNGVGKTTTIGKLAQYYAAQGKKIVLAAGDTFRAAAISQLQIWGERTGTKVVTAAQNSDAAALAYKALEEAQQAKADLLLIDTAGRLHNKSDLMQELAKIVRVIKKLDPEAPHANLLVLDATTGQNAHAQLEIFKQITNVTGLILTKLDGSAKGGVVISLAEKFKLPIHAIGVGEGADDLRPFSADDFANSLMGLENTPEQTEQI